eukprot:9179139-Lingulodinium_polyedra.AAC.1
MRVALRRSVGSVRTIVAKCNWFLQTCRSWAKSLWALPLVDLPPEPAGIFSKPLSCRVLVSGRWLKYPRALGGEGPLLEEPVQHCLCVALLVEPLLLPLFGCDRRKKVLEKGAGRGGGGGVGLGGVLGLPPPLGPIKGPVVHLEADTPEADGVPASCRAEGRLEVIPCPVGGVMEEDHAGLRLVQEPHAWTPSCGLLVDAQAEGLVLVGEGHCCLCLGLSPCLAALLHQVAGSRGRLGQEGPQARASGDLEDVVDGAEELVGGQAVQEG